MDRPQLESQLREQHQEAFGWALACCERNLDWAAEALQTSYCRLLEGAAEFQGRSSLRTFLFGVVRRVALEQRQRRLREGRLRVRLNETHEQLAGPAADAGGPDERCDSLPAALGSLSQRQGEVLHLVFYQGLTLNEAAEVMGVRPGSARRHYDRGKRALKAMLSAPARFTP